MSSGGRNNAGCGKVLLYAVLAGVALWAGSYVVAWLYHGLCYAGLNMLLALDLSAYGQAATERWPGYALLGAGLGGAAGAVAAQRRYGLARLVAVAGWVVGLALLAVLYLTLPTAEPAPDTAQARQPPEPAAPTTAKPRRTGLPDTTSHPAQGQRQVVAARLALRTNWLDLRAAPLASLRRHDTVQLLRQARHWTLVAVPATGRVGWVRSAGLAALPAPAADANEAAPTTEADEAASAGLATGATDQPTNVPDDVPAEAAHPVGQQEASGTVGSLAVAYQLDWQPSGSLSGRYFYRQQPAVVYRLTGAVQPGGELHLLEFTRGRQSARCVLQRTASGYAGTMFNTDGRQFPMTLELE